jgi:hypothetical protein
MTGQTDPPIDEHSRVKWSLFHLNILLATDHPSASAHHAATTSAATTAATATAGANTVKAITPSVPSSRLLNDNQSDHLMGYLNHAIFKQALPLLVLYQRLHSFCTHLILDVLNTQSTGYVCHHYSQIIDVISIVSMILYVKTDWRINLVQLPVSVPVMSDTGTLPSAMHSVNYTLNSNTYIYLCQ